MGKQRKRRAKTGKVWAVEPTIDTARTVGERIRALYLAKGLNRSKLRNALGCAYTTIIAWEEDLYVPDRDYLRALSVVLGVPESFILGEEKTVTREQYEAWGEFLKTTLGRSMSKNERVALGSMEFEKDDPPTVEVYAGVLYGLRGARSQGAA